MRNGVVYKVRDSSGWDRVQPSAFILASLSLYTFRSFSKTPSATDRRKGVSVIVPFGLTAKGKDVKDLSVGVGISLDFVTSAGSNIGVALACVWTQVPVLNNEQRVSLQDKTALTAGQGDTIDTALRPAMTLGIYVAPSL